MNYSILSFATFYLASWAASARLPRSLRVPMRQRFNISLRTLWLNAVQSSIPRCHCRSSMIRIARDGRHESIDVSPRPGIPHPDRIRS